MILLTTSDITHNGLGACPKRQHLFIGISKAGNQRKSQSLMSTLMALAVWSQRSTGLIVPLLCLLEDAFAVVYYKQTCTMEIN